MSESLALSELAKRLEQSKERELKQVHRIQAEKLHELSERLNERLSSELSTIEDDMTTRLYNFKEKLTEVRSGIVKQENELLKEIRSQHKEIRAEIEETERKLSTIDRKKWIIPTVIGISIIAGLAIGSWSLGAYASHQLRVIEDHKKTIVELEQLIQEQNKAKDRWIKKTWSNAIGVEKEPSVWKDTKENLWIVQFEKGQ